MMIKSIIKYKWLKNALSGKVQTFVHSWTTTSPSNPVDVDNPTRPITNVRLGITDPTR